MLRCMKNGNGVIIGMGNDEGQSGEDVHNGGIWCDWVVANDALPAITKLEGFEMALYYKENEAEDGIELRTQEEIELSPNE